jgi:hypothetical protein
MITLSHVYTKCATYLTEQGFHPQDIPKAIVFHGIFDVLILALTWGSCYTLRPSQNPFLKGPIERLVSVLPQKITASVGNTPFFNTRLGQSYIEASCLRKLIRPVAFPVKLYLTLRVARMCPDLRLFGGNSDGGGDGNGGSGGSGGSGGNGGGSSGNSGDKASSARIVASACSLIGTGTGAGAGAGRGIQGMPRINGIPDLPGIRRIALLAETGQQQFHQFQQQG